VLLLRARVNNGNLIRRQFVEFASKLVYLIVEVEFRFNNRNNPYLFRDTLLRLIASSNLEFFVLKKEEAA
jgi:hypothetical protein